MPKRFRALVLLAAFASLRWGEVTALRRVDVAEDASWVRVSRAFVEVAGKGIVAGPPKSRAGSRTVIVPEAVREEIVSHLDEFVKPGDSALLFTGEKGRAIRRGTFNPRVRWTSVLADLGLAGVHFHDLRHAGNIWASKAGMSTKDLMARMGHDDMRAALIYQRATSDADRLIAEQLSALVDEHRKGKKLAKKKGKKKRRKGDDDGPGGAAVPVA
jgi:integrase